MRGCFPTFLKNRETLFIRYGHERNNSFISIVVIVIFVLIEHVASNIEFY